MSKSFSREVNWEKGPSEVYSIIKKMNIQHTHQILFLENSFLLLSLVPSLSDGSHRQLASSTCTVPSPLENKATKHFSLYPRPASYNVLLPKLHVSIETMCVWFAPTLCVPPPAVYRREIHSLSAFPSLSPFFPSQEGPLYYTFIK